MNDALVFSFVYLMLVQLLRTLPFPEPWKQRKPLSCNICMSGWPAIAATLLTLNLSALAAGGLCFAWLSLLEGLQARSWPMPPPE